MKKMLKKLKSTAGFSLSELMMTVLLMSIVLSAVGAGVNVIRNCYENITIRSEAQVLMSTTIYTIKSDLREASALSTVSQGTVYTWDGVTGSNIKDLKFMCYSKDRGYQMYYDNSASAGIMVNGTLPLVTSKTNSSGLRAELKDIKVSGNVYYFTVRIMKKDGSQVGDDQYIAVKSYA